MLQYLMISLSLTSHLKSKGMTINPCTATNLYKFQQTSKSETWARNNTHVQCTFKVFFSLSFPTTWSLTLEYQTHSTEDYITNLWPVFYTYTSRDRSHLWGTTPVKQFYQEHVVTWPMMCVTLPGNPHSALTQLALSCMYHILGQSVWQQAPDWPMQKSSTRVTRPSPQGQGYGPRD